MEFRSHCPARIGMRTKSSAGLNLKTFQSKFLRHPAPFDQKVCGYFSRLCYAFGNNLICGEVLFSLCCWALEVEKYGLDTDGVSVCTSCTIDDVHAW